MLISTNLYILIGTYEPQFTLLLVDNNQKDKKFKTNIYVLIAYTNMAGMWPVTPRFSQNKLKMILIKNK